MKNPDVHEVLSDLYLEHLPLRKPDDINRHLLILGRALDTHWRCGHCSGILTGVIGSFVVFTIAFCLVKS